MNNIKSVNILGTEYNVIFQTLEQNKAFIDCDGYCDPSVKKLYIRQYTEEEFKDKDFGYENAEIIRKRVVRHEVLHAFMYESGLWRNSFCADMPWAMSEEMIDFYAIQTPKIFKAFESLGVL